MATFDSRQYSAIGGRSENQDVVAVSRSGDWTCWMIADGFGGHRGGDRAAQVATDALRRAFSESPTPSPEALRDLLLRSHEAVRGGQAAYRDRSAMRTTLVALVASRTEAFWAHVGDSRLYAFRENAIVHQTKDHTVAQTLVNIGEITAGAIRGHRDRNRVLQALGTEDPPRPTVYTAAHLVQPGDAFLLCTDGFWQHLHEPEMEDLLQSTDTAVAWLQAMRTRVESRTGPRSDNHSAWVIRVV